MDEKYDKVYQVLQKLIGFHRQLLDHVRAEREALLKMDLKAVQDTTYAKEGLIESIRMEESNRLKATVALSTELRVPVHELNISNIAIAIQGHDLKSAEQFRSASTALNGLIQRIKAQNQENQRLVLQALVHIDSMKKNVLGESAPHAQTYNPQGQRSSSTGASRLISKEA